MVGLHPRLIIYFSIKSKKKLKTTSNVTKILKIKTAEVTFFYATDVEMRNERILATLFTFSKNSTLPLGFNAKIYY